MKLLILVLAKPLFTFGTFATFSIRSTSEVGLIGGDAAQGALVVPAQPGPIGGDAAQGARLIPAQPEARIGPVEEDQEPVPADEPQEVPPKD